jgi:protein-disulfide isomerase
MNGLIQESILRSKVDCPGAGLVFGERESIIMVTAFLSLHCSHCARAFEKIKSILKSEEMAAFNIILITSDNKIINALYHFKRLNKDDEALDLLDQWFNADPYSRSKISETLCIPEENDILSELNNENNRLFKEYNVIGTPTFFINGYMLPSQYDIDDIKYFSEVFNRKEEVIIKSN